jgi:hypothetical protein
MQGSSRTAPCDDKDCDMIEVLSFLLEPATQETFCIERLLDRFEQSSTESPRHERA